MELDLVVDIPYLRSCFRRVRFPLEVCWNAYLLNQDGDSKMTDPQKIALAVATLREAKYLSGGKEREGWAIHRMIDETLTALTMTEE